MKIGDYVRTNDGIDKITRIEKSKDIAFCHDTIYCEHSTIPHWRNYKSSPNIIDLIEVGDYVNGEKVIALRKDISERNIHFKCKDNLIFTDIDYEIANNWYFGIDTDKIKSIVTKEQFESMEYKVVE
jgi:hypothetical protein